MMNQRIRTGTASLGIAFLLIGIMSAPTWAHCDAIDGPVVTDARVAIEREDPTLVLKWIAENDEPELRHAFEQTLNVRTQSSEARELADRYFFETLVRLHRAHEGAPYTGLKPAGIEVSPAVELADAALDQDDVDALAREVAEAVEAGIRERFASVQQAREPEDQNVEAGRAFVKEYVQFVHYVKHLHEAITGGDDHGTHR